jgi:SAM-dependent methyltransferase
MASPALTPQIFDRARIARHLARRSDDGADFVTELVRDDLATRLATISRPFGKALVMGPDARVLPVRGQSADGEFDFERVSTLLPTPGVPLVDPEALELPADDYELIVSLLDLQVVNDVPGFLARIRAHLRPDGLFMAAFLGGDSLTELRQAFLVADAEVTGGAYARVAPFIPLKDAGGLLQRTGYALPVTDVETHRVRYGDALRLMRELKALGAQNPLQERPDRLGTRGLVAAAANAYHERFADPDGRVGATLEIVWISGWAPHESQQKPLRPGSGKVRLGDVLGKPS